MHKVLNFLSERKIIVAFSGLIISYLIYLGIIRGISFKLNGDFYTILSTISACKNYISGNFNPDLFPDALLYSPHTNILSWIIAFFSSLFNFEPLKAFYLYAPLSLIAFIFSFDFFLEKLSLNPSKRALVIISTILLTPTISNINYIGDTTFTISDILTTAFTWRLPGFALFFICIGIVMEIFKHPSTKRNLILAATSFLLCNIYLVNFIVLLILVIVYLSYSALKHESIKNIFTALAFIVIGGLINLFFWQFYNVFSLITESYRDFQSSLIIQNPDDYDRNSLRYYLNTMSISLFSLILLNKEKNRLIILGTITCLVIILSSLFMPSVNIPYFWHFSIFLKIFLVIIFYKNFNFKIHSYATASIIVLTITIFTTFTARSLTAVENRPDNQKNLYQNLKQLKLNEGIILSDERTSNTLQSIEGYKVYNIPSGHVASREVSELNSKKTDELNKTLRSYNYQKLNDFFIKNKITYVVLNKDAAFTETFKLLNSNDLLFYPKISQEANLTVIKIIPIR